MSDLYATLHAQSDAPALQPQRIDHYDVGEAAGVPLGFTDAFALDNGSCLFTAVAETPATATWMAPVRQQRSA